jgi:hypothetical protein
VSAIWKRNSSQVKASGINLEGSSWCRPTEMQHQWNRKISISYALPPGGRMREWLERRKNGGREQQCRKYCNINPKGTKSVNHARATWERKNHSYSSLALWKTEVMEK